MDPFLRHLKFDAIKHIRKNPNLVDSPYLAAHSIVARGKDIFIVGKVLQI